MLTSHQAHSFTGQLHAAPSNAVLHKLQHIPLLSTHHKFMRPAITRTLYRLLQMRTDDACMYLAGTKLFEADLYDDNRLISPQQLYQLIHNARRCPDPELPFLVGQQLMQSQEPLAQLLMSTVNPSQVLRAIHSYYANWHLPLQYCQLNDNNQRHLDLRRLPASAEVQQFFEKVVCGGVALWSRHHGIEVSWYLPNHYRAEHRLWQRHLGLAVHYGRQDVRISLSQPSVQRALQSNTHRPAQNMRRHCSQLSVQVPRGITLVHAVYLYLQQQPQDSLEQVANWFAMSASTFKRKLKEEGASYSKMQDDNNRYRALQLARDLGWSNGQMADYFDISDINNFRRAFKRWTGLKPSQLKADYLA
ncbi:hypothetical protein K0504_12510 [Neiella marina]|uniref:HTH araC/xylS-type domain-containing protein n=1 Tax=Neiella holothuriorum TaxID=2870530 RepID=A0ABS7EHR7_9GAMM|nr:hypothetical protein [Neiella holothuriorum]MBW8191860.1 hypothetical protein [Neiella holothuriorum]